MHFFCLDSGDWGHPSASIVCRFSRNLWERYTVLAEVEFCPLGASLFPSHQARYFCSLVVQGIASVLVKISVGVIGAELLSSYVSEHSNLKICNAEVPELAGIDYAPLVLLCIRVIRLGVFAHLWSIILYQIFIYYRSGHRGRTPVKLCIQHSNLKFVMQGCRACWI